MTIREYIVTKADPDGIKVVARAIAGSIEQAMAELYGDDWEVHNEMGYLMVGQPSTGGCIGCLWVRDVPERGTGIEGVQP